MLEIIFDTLKDTLKLLPFLWGAFLIIELLEQMLGMKVYLDSGALVGELAPAIDARMGRMYRRTSRGI